jgi:hypothetical protein
MASESLAQASKVIAERLAKVRMWSGLDLLTLGSSHSLRCALGRSSLRSFCCMAVLSLAARQSALDHP